MITDGGNLENMASQTKKNMKNSFKKLVRDLVPVGLKQLYHSSRIIRNIHSDYKYDFLRFKELSASVDLRTKEMMQAYLIKEYHAIEKGLALPVPRPGFGGPRIERLIVTLNQYILKYGKDSTSDITIATLKEYMEFDQIYNKEENKVIPSISKLIITYERNTLESSGGSKIIKKSAIDENLDFNFDNFFKSRHSIRDFSSEPVDTGAILDAIDLAKYSPSVCNRQAWKTYVIQDSNKELKARLLEVQNGNKGFGETISALIIVTGKLSSFFSYERNQVFIDGGMFAMSLVLALHAKGLGTCCLNTSYTAEKNIAFNNAIDIDDDSVPIMFIAVGHLKPEFKIAISERKPLDEIVSVR